MRGLRALAGLLAVVALFGLSACSEDASGASADGPVDTETDGTGGGSPESILTSEGPRFVEPTNGDEVTSPVVFRIDPGPVDLSGTSVPADAGGRFHLLFDQGCIGNSQPIPVAEPGHVAFEQEATDVIAELPVGVHEVCLQFGNAYDRAYYATDTITIQVVE